MEEIMKKIIALIALALVLVMALSSCGANYAMGTGGTGGTYYAFGAVLGKQIEASTDLGCVAVSTDGSKANILGIKQGDYQLGTVQSDVMAYAWNGTNTFATDGKIDSFRVIGGLYAEAVQLITTNDNIKTVADLRGKTVSIGAAGSGVYFNAIDVLTAAGLTLEDITPAYQSFNDSAESLKDGKIDAAFVVAGAPTPAVTDLAMAKNTRLVPIDGDVAAKVMANCPYYTAYTIPANTYKGQDTDVTTITVKATLIVSAELDEDTVYEMTKAIFDNIEEITKAHAKGAELSIENATSGMTAPFHKGAAKYFAEKGVTVNAQ